MHQATQESEAVLESMESMELQLAAEITQLQARLEMATKEEQQISANHEDEQMELAQLEAVMQQEVHELSSKLLRKLNRVEGKVEQVSKTVGRDVDEALH